MNVIFAGLIGTCIGTIILIGADIVAMGKEIDAILAILEAKSLKQKGVQDE